MLDYYPRHYDLIDMERELNIGIFKSWPCHLLWSGDVNVQQSLGNTDVMSGHPTFS